MSIDPVELASLTDRELGDRIRDLIREIGTLGEQIEPDTHSVARSWRLIRSTILMAGGLFGATIEIWTVVLAGLGLWDWIDAMVEDSAIANRQMKLKQRLADLELTLAALTIELRRRKRME